MKDAKKKMAFIKKLLEIFSTHKKRTAMMKIVKCSEKQKNELSKLSIHNIFDSSKITREEINSVIKIGLNLTEEIPYLKCQNFNRYPESLQRLLLLDYLGVIQLCKDTIEIEWEGKFDKNSFGNRQGRCIHDAVEAIREEIRNSKVEKVPNQNLFALIVKIENLNLRVNEDLIKEKICTSNPNFIRLGPVKALLENGILKPPFNIQNKQPSINSIFIDEAKEILSPLLINIGLDGLGKYLEDLNIKIIQYNGNFIIIHTDELIIKSLIPIVKDWFWEKRNIELREEEIKIENLNNGFDFVDFSFKRDERDKKPIVSVKPSKRAIIQLKLENRHLIRINPNISNRDLINLIEPIVSKWSKHFKYVDSLEVFSKLDHDLNQKLRAWGSRRDRRNNKEKIKKKNNPNNEYYNIDQNTSELPKLGWKKLEKWPKIEIDPLSDSKDDE